MTAEKAEAAERRLIEGPRDQVSGEEKRSWTGVTMPDSKGSSVSARLP